MYNIITFSLLLLSAILITTNTSIYLFNGGNYALNYHSYSNPYISILELLYLNNDVGYEKEVYAEVAIGYICNNKCKDSGCIINGTVYKYNEIKCKKAKLFETIIAKYGYYDISILTIVNITFSCLFMISVIYNLIHKHMCNQNKNNNNNVENEL